MVFITMELDELAVNLRKLSDASAILFIIVNSDEQGQTIYQSLRKVEGLVNNLDDELLVNLYNKIFSVFLAGVPHQQIVVSDYFAFLQRLGTILDISTDQANKAHAVVREAISADSVLGKWRGRD